MVPTAALRETLILILFGIILVPIAAKRAQDARGYWQTFENKQQQQLHHHSNRASSTTYDNADLASTPIIQDALAHQQQQKNETALLPSAVHTSTPPRTGVTVHFGRTTAETSGVVVVVLATPAPRTRSLPRAAQVSAGNEAARSRLGHTTADSAAKASDASSKGRWTLIWMGGAIAAVAGLMSLC